MFEAGYAAAAGRHGGGRAFSFSERDPFHDAPLGWSVRLWPVPPSPDGAAGSSPLAPRQASGSSALPPSADLRAPTSASRPITSASPPGADLYGSAPVRLLVTRSSHQR